MLTRIIFHDGRFLYFEQVLLFQDGSCAIQSLVRVAVVENAKLICPKEAAEKVLGIYLEPMTCPNWVKKWIEAEGQIP